VGHSGNLKKPALLRARADERPVREEEFVREYETTIIVQPEISEEGREELLTKLDGALGKQGSKRLYIEDLGKRRLAYEIQDFQKGHYLTLHYLNSGSIVKDFERSLQLENSILRYLTVLVEPRVADVAAREAEGAELEKQRYERAAERATQRAEEEVAAREEVARKAAEEKAAAEAAAEAAEAAAAAPAEEEAAEGAEADAEATTESAPAEEAAPAQESVEEAEGEKAEATDAESGDKEDAK
jgi:small subunit ribosomal protein S6